MCTKENIRLYSYCASLSVGDPDPQDPHVFGPHVFGSIIQRCGSVSGSGSVSFLINGLSRLKYCQQNNILTQNIIKKLNILVWRWCTCGQVMKKNVGKFFFPSLKSMKKGVGSWVGSGSIIQRYGSGDLDPDPDPHQNVTDPQHWLAC